MQSNAPFNDLSSLLFMVFALGLDGFSVSLSIGLQKIRLRKMAYISIIIGLFHFILPFVGMVIGQFLSSRMNEITSFVGSILLIFIGAYMFFSAWKDTDKLSFNLHNTAHIFSVALAVSLDSFPVGLSLGLYGVKSIVIILLIGLTAMAFAIAGMLIGRKTRSLLGVYSEVLGGIILFLIGLKGIF